MKRTSKIPVVLFVLGLMAFAFGYGVVVVNLQIFPYEILRDAKQAARAVFLEITADPTGQGKYVFKTSYEGSGVTRFERAKAFPGYTLFTAFDGTKCAQYLVDMEGTVVHQWYVPYSSVWPRAPHVRNQRDDSWTCWHGKHLLSNGELIANFVGVGSPAGGGVVKLDRHSNIVWSVAENTHHDVELGEDGNFYIPAERFYASDETGPLRIAQPRGTSYNWQTPVLEDRVLVVSPDGEVVEDFSVLAAFSGSRFRGLFSVTFKVTMDFPTVNDDPTHLNDIEYITDSWARHYRGIEPGDLLISLRHVSTLAIIDRQTKLVKWALTGPFVRQHDPDLLPNGNILLYNNWKTAGEYDGSSVMEIDPRTQEIVWEYEGTADKPFFSSSRGHQQVLPNGNLLITEANGGRIFEVTRDGEIVWQYINRLAATEAGNRVGLIIGAQRFAPDELPFLTQ